MLNIYNAQDNPLTPPLQSPHSLAEIQTSLETVQL